MLIFTSCFFRMLRSGRLAHNKLRCDDDLRVLHLVALTDHHYTLSLVHTETAVELCQIGYALREIRAHGTE